MKTFCGENVEDAAFEDETVQIYLSVAVAIGILLSRLPKEAAIKLLRDVATGIEKQ